MNVEKVKGALKSVTKRYTQMRKKEERGRQVSRSSYMYQYSDRVTVKEVAFEVMEEAYMKASGGGKYLAKVRQIMYAARPAILAQATKDEFTTSYFTQVIWPEYVEEYSPDWESNVVYDARGHFTEPHTGHEISLGTTEVREYLGIADSYEPEDPGDVAKVSMMFPTRGPRHRMSAILFIEKEGFMPLFKQVNLAGRFDLGIMSTKGQSVTAARQLVDELCGQHKIPLLVLHDFDKAGLSILAGFERNTHRYTWKNRITVIDLGVRLRDVEEYNLNPEPCSNTGCRSSVEANLKRNGASEKEISFLVTGAGIQRTPGQRVELNEFTSDKLVEWIEKRLTEAGIEKVIPDDGVLETAYRRAAEVRFVNKKLKKIVAQAAKHAGAVEIPDDLRECVEDHLEGLPGDSWDEVIAEILEGDSDD